MKPWTYKVDLFLKLYWALARGPTAQHLFLPGSDLLTPPPHSTMMAPLSLSTALRAEYKERLTAQQTKPCTPIYRGLDPSKMMAESKNEGLQSL